MRRYWVFRGLRLIAFAALAVVLSGYVVMTLWNAVLPAATGLHAISFVQALALLVLSRILFGGLRGWGRRGGHWRGRMRARWQQLSPEERERFRDIMGSRYCCRASEASSSSQAE